MHTLTRLTLFIFILLGGAASMVAPAQSKTAEAVNAKGALGSISGRVQISGKGAPGVLVIARSDRPVSGSRMNELKARTDEDGYFRLGGVAAGQYTVTPFAPVFVNANRDVMQVGKTITVAAGEAIENIDFALVRGGVITGRVTDADGQPVISKYVKLTQINELGQKKAVHQYQSPIMQTDDRGIYRVYGLAAGRYLVSMGVEEDSFERDFGTASAYYARTFHPNVTDESKAEAVEVSEGGEATGIDITLGRPRPLYRATGRIIDAQSGEPVPNIVYGCGIVSPQASGLASMSGGNLSNSRGEFRLEGLMPGRYAAITDFQGETEWYSDPVMFEITDKDVSGLVIKLHRGASISGVVVVEGAEDQALLPRLSQLQLIATGVSRDEAGESRHSVVMVAADGQFRLKGLRPGKVGIYIPTYLRGGYTLLRIERGGVEEREGLEVGANEQITGVRVVLGYGTGVVRGQIKVEGGQIPDHLRLYVRARPVDGRSQGGKFIEVDARGRFLIESLIAGDYELILGAGYASGGITAQLPAMPAKQTISVTNGAEAEATFVLDLNAKEKP
jgi:Carboxypeptidase regulatory-like domain